MMRLTSFTKLLPNKSYPRCFFHTPPHSPEFIKEQLRELETKNPELFKQVEILNVKKGSTVFGLAFDNHSIHKAMSVFREINPLLTQRANENSCKIIEFKIKADTECLGVKGKPDTYYVNGSRLLFEREIDKHQLNQKDEPDTILNNPKM
jgi:hypothetical protein